PEKAPSENFQFFWGKDSIPPQISHLPFSYLTYFDFPLKISAEVRDNQGVDSVFIDYFSTYNPHRSTPLSPNPLFPDLFYTIINIPISAGDSLFYRFTAMDSAVNRNYSSSPPDGFFSIPILDGDLENFENSDGGYISSEGWEWGIPSMGPDTAHSGLKLWATQLGSEYGNNSTYSLTSAEIDLSNRYDVRLRFWHWYDFESGYDGGNVKIITDGAQQLIQPTSQYPDSQIFVLNGEPGFTGSFMGWKEEVFNINTYAGNSIKIAFICASDNSITSPGWYIDDVRVDYRTVTGVLMERRYPLSMDFHMGPGFPNPFNSITVVPVYLPEGEEASIIIYNLKGEQIFILKKGFIEKGMHKFVWNGKNSAGKQQSSGVYFVRFKGELHTKIIKLLMIK
ncbi:MAG: T9SS type A sorting domain-containing protein, partial [Fidelibacterota bacterium]